MVTPITMSASRRRRPTAPGSRRHPRVHRRHRRQGTRAAESAWKAQANSEAASGDTFGVLKLTLTATRYEWEFVPTRRRKWIRRPSAAPHPTNHRS